MIDAALWYILALLTFCLLTGELMPYIRKRREFISLDHWETWLRRQQPIAIETALAGWILISVSIVGQALWDMTNGTDALGQFWLGIILSAAHALPLALSPANH